MINTPLLDESLLNLDYWKKLSPALIRGEADVVARCLFAAERRNDFDFMRSIPASTFSEVLRTLDPGRFIVNVVTLHMELRPAMLKYMGVTDLPLVVYKYVSILWHIVDLRRAAGLKPSLTDYTLLLRSVRDLGNRWLSDRFWKTLITDGYHPTTDCYNYRMSARLWHGLSHPRRRQKERVIWFHQLARKLGKRPMGFSNYRVGGGGIRERTLNDFQDMVKNNVPANEETYRIIIMAVAREGDMATVHAILKKIWDIDATAFIAGQDESTILPKTFPKDSALRPTPGLLFAIAHAFGINNDVPSALRLVDFVARHYDLDITMGVWRQLFEWTFVLSAYRSGTAQKDGSRTGELPRGSVGSLWDTMTGPPYYVQPTMGMYNHSINNLVKREQQMLKAAKRVQEALIPFEHQRVKTQQALEDLERGIVEAQQAETLAYTDQKSVESLRNRWEYMKLMQERDTWWAQRWLKLLLQGTNNAHRRPLLATMCITDLPLLLWEWRNFAPDFVKYEIRTGFVSFNFRTKVERDLVRASQARVWENEQSILSAVPKYVGETWFRTRPPSDDETQEVDQDGAEDGADPASYPAQHVET